MIAEGPAEPFIDDRLEIGAGDRILLIIEDDPFFAKVMVDHARQQGLKALVALGGADGLDLARQYRPTAISLDVFLPDMLGWTVLSQLKQNPLTRHIPVQITTMDDDDQHGLSHGAFAFLKKPASSEQLTRGLGRLMDYAGLDRKRLLIVEDNPAEQSATAELLGGGDIDIVTVGTGAEALARMRTEAFHCVVLDLRLPDMSGFDVLEEMNGEAGLREIPVVVYHRPRADAEGRSAAPYHGAQHRGERRRVARAAVVSDHALPAPRGLRPSASQAAAA